MDLLSFISKFIGVTARVGAVFALAALSVWIGRRAGIEFFVTLEPVLFQGIIVVGIIGLFSFLVEAAIAIAKGIWSVFEVALPVYFAYRSSRRTALKNMTVGVLPREYADVLRFLKTNNLQRFLAPNYTTRLQHLREACLLDIDDSNWSAHLSNTYYAVPDYVWREIDHGWLKDHPVPSFEPWLFPR